MLAQLTQLGVAFQYPDNWILEESETESGHGEVTVFSPGGSFWSLAVYPPKSDPRELADAALAVLKKEYPDADVESVTETIANQEFLGYDLNFFYLDLTSTGLVRSLAMPKATYLIVCQSEDREFDRLGQVFRAITTSLLTEPDAGK